MQHRQSRTERGNALWGAGSRGESRSSALWGDSAKNFAVPLAILAIAAPMMATGAPAPAAQKAYVAPGLLAAAEASPGKTFSVIVQSDLRNGSEGVARQVRALAAEMPRSAPGLKKKFATVNGVSAELSGDQIVELSRRGGLHAITPDGTLRPAFTSNQQWPYQSQLTKYWELLRATPAKAPTIAVVDSGIERRADFGDRIVADVKLTTLANNSPGDGRGHGTFVAGIAAGSAPWYTGGSPASKIVSLDVMDDSGMAKTSEVIAAADWILRNKSTYGIRVANFSLHSSNRSSFMYDPLNKAVERLWFAGIVVVAASGNYGVNGQPSGVHYAPGNDPFIITAGAYDGEGTMGASDDINAPWSAYGYTPDGFSKPDVGAPGRYMVGPVPVASTLVAEKPLSVKAAGYMQLSGTSFAAPVVSAAAAYVLAVHPEYTPDQVKGALMVTSIAAPDLAPRSMGVGEIRADSAAKVVAPPNPNAALNRFLTPDPTGGATQVFDAASWSDAVQSSVSWDSASWSDASWDSASWDSASWSDVSWSDVSWDSASWSDSVSQEAAGFESVSWADNAADDFRAAGAYLLAE
ncbi:MAG: S8 family serine peptidase [Gaiellaceae bacterium]